MSVIEEALRTAQAEAEKEELEEAGYRSLAGMVSLPRSAARSPVRTVLLALLGVLVLGGGGWAGYHLFAADAAGGERAGAGATAPSGGPRGPTGDGGGVPAIGEASSPGPASGAVSDSASERMSPDRTGTVTGPDPTRLAASPERDASDGRADPGAHPETGEEDEAGTPAAGDGGEEAEGPEQAAADGTDPDPDATTPDTPERSEAAGAEPDTAPTGESADEQGGAEEPSGTEVTRRGESAEDGAVAPARPAVAGSVRVESAGAGETAEPTPAETVPTETEAPDSAPAQSEVARRLFREAVNLGDAGDLEGAIQRYRRAVEADSTYAEAWNNLGVALNRDSQPAEAAGALRKALELRPGYEAARSNLGAALLAGGEYQAAVEAYREMLAKGSAPVEVYVNLGLAYRKMGRLEPARRALEAALRVDPNAAVAHYNLGRVLEASGERFAAIDHYRAFLEAGAGSQDLRARLRIHLDRLRQGGRR